MDSKYQPDGVSPVLPIVNLMVAGGMLWLSYSVAVWSSDPSGFQWVLFPSMMLAAAAGVCAVVGLVFSPGRLKALMASSIALGMLWLPWKYALANWPGGDDGVDLVVGFGCLTSFFVAMLTLYFGTKYSRRTPDGVSPVPLAVNLVVSGGVLWLSYSIAVNAYSGLLTIPTMILAAVAGVVAAVGLMRRSGRLKALVASCVALGLLWVPWKYALSSWPGGDDGPGMGWAFVVGFGCLTSFFVAVLTLYFGTKYRRRSSD